jgi:DNA-binding MarR family transcriptional regulator
MVTRVTPSETDASKDQTARKAIDQRLRQYNTILPAVAPNSDPKAIALLLELSRAAHAQFLANCRAADSVGLSISVTGKRLGILRTLNFAPEQRMTLGALSKYVHLSPAAATNYVDSLTRGSLVRRYCSPSDPHTNIIELTPRGEAAFMAIVPALSTTWTEACAGFTDEEKDTLIRLLGRLVPATGCVGDE